MIIVFLLFNANYFPNIAKLFVLYTKIIQTLKVSFNILLCMNLELVSMAKSIEVAKNVVLQTSSF